MQGQLVSFPRPQGWRLVGWRWMGRVVPIYEPGEVDDDADKAADLRCGVPVKTADDHAVRMVCTNAQRGTPHGQAPMLPLWLVDEFRQTGQVAARYNKGKWERVK